jgi:hypothetical protein
MSNFQHEDPAPIAQRSNFHAGQIEAKTNFHTGQSNFHAGENFHAGSLRKGEESDKGLNFHAGNFHVGQLNIHAGNFHAGNFHAGNFHVGQVKSHATENLDTGNFHAGNFHAGNFHAGQLDSHATKNSHTGKFHAGNFHAGNFHAGNFHAGNFHAGELISHATENFHTGNFHSGNFHAGNFHAGANPPMVIATEKSDARAGSAESTKEVIGQEHNFHTGDRSIDMNFHSGAMLHAGNFHAGGNTEGDNFHAGDASKTPSMHVGMIGKQNFHAGSSKPFGQADYDVSEIINFHAGQPSGQVAGRQNTRSQPPARVKGFETNLSFYASTFDGKPGFNYVEKPANGIYSNVTTSSHQLFVRDIRGLEDQLNLDRDAVLTVSNIPDHGYTFADDAAVIKDFYPDVEQLLLEHVPGAQRVFIFDHTIRRKSGDRGPVLRAHIDQTPASALARVVKHLPDEAARLTKGRVRLINFWRPINGTVENYPLAFALSGSVPNTKLESVKHHYPTWTGETYGVGYSEGQIWCYWGKMGNSDALLLQCFDSEKGGRLSHSAVVDPTSTSQKCRESVEVRALVFG